jgi:hypothetical protein
VTGGWLLLWLLIVLNFLICCWDAWVAGIIWEKAQSTLEQVLAACAFVMGYVGFFYTMILVGIVTNYLPREWLLAANVYLGAPIILTGIFITIHGWIQTIRTRSITSGLVSVWNTFAIIHDIRVWLYSVRALKDIGGLKGLWNIADDTDSKKAKIALFGLLALVLTTLIIFGLFRAGQNYAREH